MFPEHTQILTDSGPMDLGDIRVGMLVRTAAGRYRPVLKIHGGLERSWIRITTDNDLIYPSVCCTPGQLLMVRRKQTVTWRQAGSIRPSYDEVYVILEHDPKSDLAECQFLMVFDAQHAKLTEATPVLGLEIEEDASFSANSFLVRQ